MMKPFCPLLVLAMVLPILAIDDDDGPQFWCWTKPAEPSKAKKWDLKLGGPNWGYCSDPSEALNEKVDYEIQTMTSNIEGAGAKGAFFIQLFGDEGKSEELMLSEGFVQGTTVKKKVSAPRIGDPTKIILKYTGAERYRCSTIRVTQGAKFWDFDCGIWLQCPKACFEEIPLAGRSKYKMEISTKGSVGAATTADLYIKIQGTNADTQTKILAENGFEAGSSVDVTVLGKDVGEICGIKISMTKHESWAPESISIIKEGGEKKEWKELKQSIMCPVMCELSLKTKCGPDAPKKKKPKKKKKGGEKKKGGGGGGDEAAEDDEEGGGDEEEQVDPQLVFNNYMGLGLTLQEQTKMIKLGCDTSIKDNDDFGGIWMDNRINHQLYIAYCPPGCDKNGDSKPKGIGLHPDDSSICKSGLVDNAVGVVGGVVGVATYIGIDNYDKGDDKMVGIEVASAKSSAKSFAVVKVDNIDMADLDVRILDYMGQPTHMGRVEFRLDGIWGSLCAKGMSQSAGRRICRDLKYKDGSVMNPAEGGDSFCKSVMGENYCGSEQSSIHFQSLQCEGSENNIMQCNRELAMEECSHNDDVILECSMVDFDVEQPPKDKTIRLVDDKGAASSTGSGRLEIYMGKWGSICNYDFDDQAAKVACWQMGYDIGKIIGNQDEQGVCTNYNEKNYCGSGPIHMVHVKCKGKEPALDKCSYKTWPFVHRCGHDNDIIIQCEGLKGDASGKSQQPDIPIYPPKIGKLPLVPIIKGTCGMTLEEGIFRGDPGSIFLVHCPKGCDGDQSGSVFGTAIYPSGSSICRSAIHAGVLQHFGGLIEVAKQHGQSQYQGSLNRDINSVDYEATDIAYVTLKPNSLAIRLAQSFQGREVVGICKNCASFIQQTIHLQINPTYGLYKEKQQALRLQDKEFPHFLESNARMERYLQSPIGYHEDRAKRRTKRLEKMRKMLKIQGCASSFMQSKFLFKQKKKEEEKSGKVGSGNFVYKWYPESGYEFTGKEKDILYLVGTPGESETGSLRIFTIALKFELSQPSDDELTLVSHSACGCYALTMTTDHQLVFKKRCGTEFIFNSHFYIGIKQPVSVVLTTSPAKTTFYIDGEMFNYVNAGANFVCEKNLDIGGFSDQMSELWIGFIDYVLIYDRVLSEGEIKELHKKGSQRPPSGLVKGIRHTLDGRKCDTVCTSNPRPGQKGAPAAPKESELGQPQVDEDAGDNSAESSKTEKKQKKEGGTKKEGGQEEELNEGMPDDIVEGEEDKDDEDGGAASIENSIGCGVSGSDAMFEGATGKKFRVSCPTMCTMAKGTVIGTMIYADGSHICAAAVHAGFLDKEKGGEVIMVIANGQPYYQASLQNNVQSANKLGSARSFTFEKAKKSMKISNCQLSAQDTMFQGAPLTKFTVHCPENCSAPPVQVYGSAFYTDDSSICQAAIHYGTIGDKGGEVTIQIEEGQKRYKGSSQNGVESLSHGEFIRSFTVIGQKGNTCEYFEEKYNPSDIFKNWKAVDYVKAEKGPSEWSFNKHPEKEGMLAIEQGTPIKGDRDSLGTYLFHQKFECPNALLKANIFYKGSPGRSAILFRYKDIDNYLALEFNNPVNNVRLIRKMGTETKELATQDRYTMYPRVWYRWKIYYNEKNIRVYYQNHLVRQTFKLFNTEDEDGVSRGSVGLAVDNNDGVIFDGVTTQEADLDLVERGSKQDEVPRRTWSMCMGAEKKSKRKKFCTMFYGGYVQGVTKCTELHRFCQICCEKNINKLENILYFACFRSCISDAQVKDKAEALKKAEEEEQLKKLNGEWVPVEGDKADYEVSGEWKKVIIKKIDKSDPEELIFEVEDEEGEVTKDLKQDVVKACGKGLEGRRDCV